MFYIYLKFQFQQYDELQFMLLLTFWCVCWSSLVSSLFHSNPGYASTELWESLGSTQIKHHEIVGGHHFFCPKLCWF